MTLPFLYPDISPESDKHATTMGSDNASNYNIGQGSSTSQNDQNAPSPPSLVVLPTELVEKVCQYLDPADIASLREGSNIRLSEIARPFLAPRTCQLYYSHHSLRRLLGFLRETKWKRRIETIQYNIRDGAHPKFKVLSRAEYARMEFDRFSDEAHKAARFQAYHNWHTAQVDQGITELDRCNDDANSIREAMEQLPNLRSVDIVIAPCTARGCFIHRIQRGVKPHGKLELCCIWRQLMDPKLKTTCTSLRVVGVDQSSFHGLGPDWDTDNPANPITKLELLLKDEYCRATWRNWSLGTVGGFLKCFPNLEDLTLGLDVCQELDCLGEFFVPPSIDHRQQRFLPLSCANLSRAEFRIPKLRRLTLKNVRLSGENIVKFVDNHLANHPNNSKERAGEKEEEEEEEEQQQHLPQKPDCPLELNLINFQLEHPASKDFKTLTTELVSQRGVMLNVFTVDHLTGQEERGKFYVYDERTDVRRHTDLILRRKNGKDYRATSLGLSIRAQRGGIIGEDVVLLDHL